MCQASALAKDASAKMSDTIHDFAHFKLDPQTATKLVSLCFVCSEEGLGALEGAPGCWPKGQELGAGSQIDKSSDKGTDGGRSCRSNSFQNTGGRRGRNKRVTASKAGGSPLASERELVMRSHWVEGGNQERTDK